MKNNFGNHDFRNYLLSKRFEGDEGNQNIDNIFLDLPILRAIETPDVPPMPEGETDKDSKKIGRTWPDLIYEITFCKKFYKPENFNNVTLSLVVVVISTLMYIAFIFLFLKYFITQFGLWEGILGVSTFGGIAVVIYDLVIVVVYTLIVKNKFFKI